MSASISSNSIDQRILDVQSKIVDARKEKWWGIAQMVALVAGLILLATVVIVLTLPSPLASTVLPTLSAIFIVNCILPTIVFMRKKIPQVKAAHARLIENQTHLETLMALRKRERNFRSRSL